MDSRGLKAFREAMAKHVGGVTIVTTRDESLSDWGVTATAVSFLSLEPPLVLVALLGAAGSTAAFGGAERFAVSILRPEHEDLAVRFATGRPDKFILGGFEASPVSGLPVVRDALAVVECRRIDTLPGGDHEIVVGEVDDARAGSGPALVHFDGDFTAVGT